MTQVQESSEARAARPAPARNGWPGVAALALGTFTVVTSEMLPVGLLTPMGRSLGVPEGVAGLTLTITGLVAALSAPALVPLLGRADRRTALCVLVAVLVVGNLGAAWAPDFGTMVVARVLVGIGMGGVWAVAAGLAVRLVPAKSAGTATSLVFSGIAVASVLGVPAGTYLGALAGWRAAFLAAAGLGAVVLVAAALLLPRLPAERTVPLGGVLRLTRDPGCAPVSSSSASWSPGTSPRTPTSGRFWRTSPASERARSAPCSWCTESPAWPGTSSPGPEPPAHRARRCW